MKIKTNIKRKEMRNLNVTKITIQNINSKKVIIQLIKVVVGMVNYSNLDLKIK